LEEFIVWLISSPSELDIQSFRFLYNGRVATAAAALRLGRDLLCSVSQGEFELGIFI
jgi:hypothetical protein